MTAEDETLLWLPAEREQEELELPMQERWEAGRDGLLR